MTIKQQGGIFGRNPSFNNADVETLDVTNVNQDGPTVMNLSAGTVAIDIDTNISSSEGNVSIVKAKTVNDRYATIDLVRLGSTKTGLSFYTTNAGTLQEAATFNDVGNLAFPSGQGIDFSATSGTGTSELFDDYEEGVHIATLTADTGTITINTASDTLKYVKIGSAVHVWGRVSVLSVSSPTGKIELSLPFAVENSTEGSNYSAITCYVSGSVSLNAGDFAGLTIPGQNYCRLFISTVSTLSSSAANAQQLQGGSQIYVNMIYSTTS